MLHIPLPVFRLTVCAVATAWAGTVWAQVDVNVQKPPPARVPPRSLESAVYLQLYAHPDTARREIEVRVRNGTVELRGTVASDAERQLAERMALLVAPDVALNNRLRVRPGIRPFRAARLDEEVSLATVERRCRVLLEQEFSPDVLDQLTLTPYIVAVAADRDGPADTASVMVLQGTVPSLEHQVAASELLVAGGAASAVLNRTFVARPPGRSARPSLRIRVPFFRMDLDVDEEGVDLDLLSPGGPVRVRTGGKYSQADDQTLVEQYRRVVRADAELGDAELRSFALAGVLTLEGLLRPADKMRAVNLALQTPGARGVVDRSEALDGGPPYHAEPDLTAYLRHRLTEHADTWDVAIDMESRDSIKVQMKTATMFHAALATTVVGQDAALGKLPLDLQFVESAPEKDAP